MKLSSITPKGKNIVQQYPPQMNLCGLWNRSLAIAQVFIFIFGRKPNISRFREDQLIFAAKKALGKAFMQCL